MSLITEITRGLDALSVHLPSWSFFGLKASYSVYVRYPIILFFYLHAPLLLLSCAQLLNPIDFPSIIVFRCIQSDSKQKVKKSGQVNNFPLKCFILCSYPVWFTYTSHMNSFEFYIFLAYRISSIN